MNVNVGVCVKIWGHLIFRKKNEKKSKMYIVNHRHVVCFLFGWCSSIRFFSHYIIVPTSMIHFFCISNESVLYCVIVGLKIEEYVVFSDATELVKLVDVGNIHTHSCRMNRTEWESATAITSGMYFIVRHYIAMVLAIETSLRTL